jgi:hypothetical protein
MHQSAPSLHLVIPGFPGLSTGTAAAPLSRRLPVLETILARADTEPYAGNDRLATLFHLFGHPDVPDGDLPSAALCRLADSGAADGDYWLHADPVQLRPDMDRLLLFDARALAIDPQEAAALARQIEAHFADLGWRLETPAPDRWYLGLQETPAISTTPLETVTGRSVAPFLPKGPDAVRWRALINELQMLLFHAPENQQRRARGHPEIGGLWLWGGGRLPPVGPPRWQRVFAEQPLMRGFGRLSGTITIPWPRKSELGAEVRGDCLGLLDDLATPLQDQDMIAWEQALADLEPHFAALLEGLRQHTMETLWLYPCDGRRLRITPRGLWRVWRRLRPLRPPLSQASGWSDP